MSKSQLYRRLQVRLLSVAHEAALGEEVLIAQKLIGMANELDGLVAWAERLEKK